MMGKIKVMFLCLLLGITGVALFFFYTKPDPALRALAVAYENHQGQFKKNPNDPQLLYNEAWFLAQQQKYAEALAVLTQALKHSPTEARYLYTQAWLYQQLGEEAKAAQVISQAQTLPFEPRNLTEALRIHLLNQTPAEGLKKINYEIAKQLDPPQGLFYWRSLFQEQLAAYDAAVTDLNRLLTPPTDSNTTDLAAPIQAKLLQQRATLYEKGGHYKEALADLQTAMGLKNSKLSATQRQNLQAHLFALQRYSDPDRNISALQTALKNSPQDKRLHYLLMDSLLEKEDLATAKEKLLNARSAAPEDPTLWCLQARYQFAEKNVEAAKITLKEAKKRDPEGNNPCILRETLRQLTDPAQALSYWKSHPEIQPVLSPALQHKDFKNLRKSLESL